MAKSETSTVVVTNDVDALLRIVTSATSPKSVKQAALNKIRDIEAKERRTIFGGYNRASRNPSEMARVEEESAA